MEAISEPLSTLIQTEKEKKENENEKYISFCPKCLELLGQYQMFFISINRETSQISYNCPRKHSFKNSDLLKIPLSSPSLKDKLFCSLHPSGAFIAWCNSCKINLCKECLKSNWHNKHRVENFYFPEEDDIKLMKEKNEEFKKAQNEINERLNERIQEVKKGYEKFIEIVGVANERNERCFNEYFKENILNYQTIENVRNIGMFKEEEEIMKKILKIKVNIINDNDEKDPNEKRNKYMTALFNIFGEYGRKLKNNENMKEKAKEKEEEEDIKINEK